MEQKLNFKFLIKSSIITLGGLFLFAVFAIPIHFFIIKQYSKNIDPRVQRYYESFVQEAKTHGTDVSNIGIIIQFTNIQKPEGILVSEGEQILGECGVKLGLQPSIKINQAIWSQLSEVKKEWTIFHELGHCFLLKGHTNDVSNFHHKSLMSRLAFNDAEYTAHRQEYLNELFSYKPYHVADYLNTFFFIPAADQLYSYQNKMKVAINLR